MYIKEKYSAFQILREIEFGTSKPTILKHNLLFQANQLYSRSQKGTLPGVRTRAMEEGVPVGEGAVGAWMTIFCPSSWGLWQLQFGI